MINFYQWKMDSNAQIPTEKSGHKFERIKFAKFISLSLSVSPSFSLCVYRYIFPLCVYESVFVSILLYLLFSLSLCIIPLLLFNHSRTAFVQKR